jgi:hypothetical protein
VNPAAPWPHQPNPALYLPAPAPFAPTSYHSQVFQDENDGTLGAAYLTHGNKRARHS